MEYKEEIENLILIHWEYAKNLERNGIKYSDKYTQEEMHEWWLHCFEIQGFEETKERILYTIKYNKLYHPV
jgi:hypothetical protein